MNTLEAEVSSHYARTDLLKAIEEGFRETGRSPDILTVQDLGAVDEYHIRGRDATGELLERLTLTERTRVLDVGCGIGGTCRYIADTYRSRVTGLDLSDVYCRVAGQLSKRVGLAGLRFVRGSAVAMPFADGQFDVVLSQHVQMNVSDKSAYFGELARMLAPQGELGLYEVCAGSKAETFFPVPWAEDASISFLVPPEVIRAELETAGLEIEVWRDVTEDGRAWFDRILARVEKEGPPPVGLHLLMGGNAKAKMENVLRNLKERRITVIQAVARK